MKSSYLFHLLVLLATLLVALVAADDQLEDPLKDPVDDDSSWLGETRKKAPIRKRRPGKRQDDAQCGISRFEDVGRIRNGQIAEKGAFPWMVRLTDGSRGGKGGRIAFCGGSIINEYFILTAAHCVEDYIEVAVVGDHLVKEDDRQETAHKIAERFVHPKYDSDNIRNDIALLKLSKPIKWTQYVRPVCLPDSNLRIEDHANLTIAGFGTVDSRNPSEVLRMANVPLVPHQTCSKTWGNSYVKESMICAGHQDKRGQLKHDTCQGDSGGPLLYRAQNRWTITGITSFGERQCRELYGVYTRVTKYANWIKKIINSRS